MSNSPQRQPWPGHGPSCPCAACRKRHHPQDGYWAGSAPTWWAAIGGVWGVLSVIVWAVTDSNASACHNALVGALAPGQCTDWTTAHDLAAFSALAALAVFVFSIYLVRKGAQR